jgi:hypothetical protein
VEFPLKDREQFVNMWNGQFPTELTEGYRKLAKFGIVPGGSGIDTSPRLTVTQGTRAVSALIQIDSIGPVDNARAAQGHIQQCFGFIPDIRRNTDIVKWVTLCKNSTSKHATLHLTPGHICHHLGADKGMEFIEWMNMTAEMYDELRLASRTLTDIFTMAKTAGQIKRMVPDLMQYLPQAQREAFEEQKRSSTVPFEWAPYPKENIDKMLLQVSKGHLLSGLNKPALAETTVQYLDYATWSRYAEWA